MRLLKIKKKQTLLNYEYISWIYINTTGIKAGAKLKIEIWQAVTGLDNNMKLSLQPTIDESGVLKAKIDWKKIPKIKESRIVYIQVKDENDKVLYDADGRMDQATLTLQFSPTAVKMVENKAAVVVGTQALMPKSCFCKDFDLIWGNKVSCDFRKKVVNTCKELWGESRKIEMANGLMAVMNVETGGSFKAHQIMGKGLKDVNQITKDDFWLTKSDGTKTSRAVGLIQFTQSALVQIGEFTNGSGFDKLHEVKLRFAKMGEIAQLDYVKKYFNSSKDKIKTPEDIYLHVFAPSGVDQKDEFVLYSKGTEEYRQNKSIDEENNGDGKIQRSEILGRYNKSKSDGASSKSSDFSCQTNSSISATGIVTYHIYSNGKIEKHTPKVIEEGQENKIKYIYHDKNSLEHEVCIVDFVTAQNWVRGSKTDGGVGWESRVAGGKTRYYLKGEGTNDLVKIPLPLNYNNNGVIIKYSDNTTREYMNPKAFASILGALAECNYNDITMNGFTSSDGTGAPSVSHINGIAGDFRYLRKDLSGDALHINLNPNDLDVTRQEELIDAFVKFGYSTFLSFNIIIDGKPFILKKSSHLEDHHHHIHLNKQSYTPNYSETNES